MTYRENIEGTFWFPTYTHADDFLHFTQGDVHIRMTVRYKNYKRFGSTIKIASRRPSRQLRLRQILSNRNHLRRSDRFL